MAANRKLQAEIDRCLKKVAEGVEKFEEIWQKVYNATNANQKEKYEEDLKKEIKKLQRLRDQIKTWIASSNINDKSVLLEKRKLIEQQMERFKVVERETKTKAYSKEGLTSGAKLDPHERERHEISQWLNHCLDSLNLQIDSLEAEIESIATTTKKKKGRGGGNNEVNLEEAQSLLEKHRDHVQKLETLLRMLTNDNVNIEQIKNIREDVEYYIENCREPDFAENEMIYDDIDGLEEMLLEVPNNVKGSNEHNNTNSVSETSETMSTNSANSPVPFSSQQHNHSSEHDAKRRHKSSSDDGKTGASKSNASGAPKLQTQQSMPATMSSSSTLTNHSVSSTSSPTVVASVPASSSTSSISASVISSAHPPSSAPSSASTTSLSQQHLTSTQVSSSLTTTSVTHSTSQGRSTATTAAKSSSDAMVSSPSAANNSAGGDLVNHIGNGSEPSESPALQSSASGNSNHQQQPNFAAAVQQNGHVSSLSDISTNGVASLTNDSSKLNNNSNANLDQVLPLKSIAQEALSTQGLRNLEVEDVTDPTRALHGFFPKESRSHVICSTAATSVSAGGTSISSAGDTGTLTSPAPKGPSEAHIPPLLGVAPLGPVALNKETRFQYKMLEAAFQHMPHPSDSERLRPYLPRNPCPTPPYYPQLPPIGSDSIEFFQRLSTETLFFIFYYMEGTRAQYLAAKALKSQSWRFHNKYMMWFQRHEEPKIINDEYEQGTYIYFDFEKWGQRKKEGFTFEYRFLEDRDLS